MLGFVVYVLCSLLLLVIDSFTPLQTVEWLLHIVLAWYGATMLRLRLLPYVGIISTGCILLGAAISPASTVPLWTILTNRAIAVLSIAIIVVFAGRQRRAVEAERRLYRQLQESQREIRVLRGILPICGHCKRIREDTGAWRQMEEYIRERSEAMFSHGICEDCARVIYPHYHHQGFEQPPV